MSDTLEEQDGKVIIGSRTSTIDTLAEEEQGIEALSKSFDKTCRRYAMEISA